VSKTIIGKDMRPCKTIGGMLQTRSVCSHALFIILMNRKLELLQISVA